MHMYALYIHTYTHTYMHTYCDCLCLLVSARRDHHNLNTTLTDWARVWLCPECFEPCLCWQEWARGRSGASVYVCMCVCVCICMCVESALDHVFVDRNEREAAQEHLCVDVCMHVCVHTYAYCVCKKTSIHPSMHKTIKETNTTCIVGGANLFATISL